MALTRSAFSLRLFSLVRHPFTSLILFRNVRQSKLHVICVIDVKHWTTFNMSDNHVSLRTTVTTKSASGGQGFVRCDCKGQRRWQANRRKCFKAKLKCNSRCRGSLTAQTKWRLGLGVDECDCLYVINNIFDMLDKSNVFYITVFLCLCISGTAKTIYCINKVDVLHVRLTELHAAHQNLHPPIRTLRVKETIRNIHQNRTKSDNCGSYVWFTYNVSSGQISWKSLEPRPRYGDFYIFQDGGQGHLGFLKFHFLRWYFGFSKFKSFRGSNSITVPDFVEIARTAAEICKFQYYASLAWKCPFTPLFGFFWGTFTPNDVTHRPNPKKTILGLNHVIWAINHEIFE